MSRSGLPHDAIEYPCSDGQPMAETQLHGASMAYVNYALKRWFGKGGRSDVHVGMNSFLYYEQGNPRAVVAPEYLRDTYLLWNEPKGPDFVLEVTSASTRRDDERRKRGVYASLGVSEYFLYDPRAEYLTPPLQGWRLRGESYELMPAVTVLPGRGTVVTSEVLGLEFRDEREERMVRLRDPTTGQNLLTYEEAERAREEEVAARREESAGRREAEARIALEVAARQKAEARAAELEARLRAFESADAESNEPRC